MSNCVNDKNSYRRNSLNLFNIKLFPKSFILSSRGWQAKLKGMIIHFMQTRRAWEINESAPMDIDAITKGKPYKGKEGKPCKGKDAKGILINS